ncbi:MAG TPA: sulfatase-like hydrolase/transferase, partial [Candidatus Hydrogenedentes bacterium]|nr:sulfatase-like hydrolase/transferase [Candidatus Hydrogenedentota bacterium]
MLATLLVAFAAAPDVFIISVDTLRADRLGCYGHSSPTSPNLDAFAKDALLFEDCVAEVPLTSPSFGAMMTSRYPR